MTGGLAGKGVTTHFKAFMHADDDILQASVRTTWRNINCFRICNQTNRTVHYAICMRNLSLKISAVIFLSKASGSCVNENLYLELRYSMALQDKEGKQLPPTLGTLIPHIKRSFYLSFIWKNTEQSSQLIIYPSDFGWVC